MSVHRKYGVSGTGNDASNADRRPPGTGAIHRVELITIRESHEIVKVRYVNPSGDADRSPTVERDGNDESPNGAIARSNDGCADVNPDAPIDGLYAGSNGRYYTDHQVATKLRTGRWKPCIRQRNPDRRLVATGDGTLLLLTATDDLPAWAELRIDDGRAHVIDTRRPVPGDAVPE